MMNHARTPNMIPFAIEYVRGIIRNARYPPTASARSPSNSIFLMEEAIKKPTITRAGAVAKLGIARKIGDRNRATKNRIPVVIAVRPVFPPSATPELDSTKLVTVEVPSIEPATVPIASAIRTRPTRGRLPSSSSRSAFSATPITVPMVSNISTNRNENTITTNSDT